MKYMNKFDFKLALKYLLQAIVIGILGGLLYCLYNYCSSLVTKAWESEGALHFSIAMPFIGLLIVLTERLFKLEGAGCSNAVIKEAGGAEATMPVRASICSFITLLLTNLAETVTGREGASWQLAAPIAKYINGRWFSDTQKRIAISCAIGSGFGCLWGLPLFGAVIGSEMAFGSLYFPALGPSLVSSYIARYIALILFPNHTLYIFEDYALLDAFGLVKLLILSVAVGLLSRAYVLISDNVNRGFGLIKDTYIRIFVGGVIVGTLCYFVGKDYLCGVNTIMYDALAGIEVPWYSFMAKMVFFLLLIKSGYKTGILIQTMSIGALFGSTFGSLVGMPLGLSAAVSLVALVGASFNVPIAAIALAYEAFGKVGFEYCVISIIIARIVSRTSQIYAGQDMKQRKPIVCLWKE